MVTASVTALTHTMVTGLTNKAVDNIALLVSRANIPLCRIGDKKSIDPALHEFTLDGRQDDYPNKFVSKKFLKSAKVIFATCVGCGTSLLDKFQFAFVIVDEASYWSRSQPFSFLFPRNAIISYSLVTTSNCDRFNTNEPKNLSIPSPSSSVCMTLITPYFFWTLNTACTRVSHGIPIGSSMMEG